MKMLYYENETSEINKLIIENLSKQVAWLKSELREQDKFQEIWKFR